MTLGQKLQVDTVLSKENNDWDFVSKYYPDYYGSDEIMHNGDLAKLYDQDGIEEGDGADTLLKEEYGGDINNPKIKLDFLESELQIYKDAIKGYLQTLN